MRRLRFGLKWRACADDPVAAAMLGIHENTVRYRIRQCEDRLDRPIGPEDFGLQAALVLVDHPNGAQACEGDADVILADVEELSSGDQHTDRDSQTFLQRVEITGGCDYDELTARLDLAAVDGDAEARAFRIL
mgnify:CR=1 FL=1